MKILTLLIEAAAEENEEAEVVVKIIENGLFYCGIRQPSKMSIGQYAWILEDAIKNCAEVWLNSNHCKSKWMQLNEAIHGDKS